jgi:hypothetical protein
MAGFALCFALAAARREYLPEMVMRFDDLPMPGRVIKIKDGNNGLVCVAADNPKLRIRSYPDNDTSLAFDKYLAGRYFSIVRGSDTFKFCYKCDSGLNGYSLGSFKEFVWENKRLHYVTAGGEPCGSGAYGLKAEFACDKTLHKGQFDIPFFNVSGDPKCAVTALIRSRYACRIANLSTGANGVYNIKCINADIYEKGKRQRNP